MNPKEYTDADWMELGEDPFRPLPEETSEIAHLERLKREGLFNWEGEFTRLLNSGGSTPAFNFLYDNRNAMPRTSFDECLLQYGKYVYEEG